MGSTSHELRHDSLGPSCLESLLRLPKSLVGPLVHSFGTLRKRVGDATVGAETLPNLQRARCSSGERRFILRLVLQPMAEPATEVASTVQDPAPTLAGKTFEPKACAPQWQRHRHEGHDLVHADPLIVLAVSIDQPQTLLEEFDTDRPGFATGARPPERRPLSNFHQLALAQPGKIDRVEVTALVHVQTVVAWSPRSASAQNFLSPIFPEIN